MLVGARSRLQVFTTKEIFINAEFQFFRETGSDERGRVSEK